MLVRLSSLVQGRVSPVPAALARAGPPLLLDLVYHGVTVVAHSAQAVGHQGSEREQERKVAAEDSAAGNWNEFYRKIKVTGEREHDRTEDEARDPLANASEAERAEVVAKLTWIRHTDIVPRMMRSVIDQVFYVVEGTRYNLGREIQLPEWRALVALEMYQFYTALENAADSAREIEELTGCSGAEIAAQRKDE